jgi:hypothetical protein
MGHIMPKPEAAARVIRAVMAEHPDMQTTLRIRLSDDDETLFADTMDAISMLPLPQRRDITDLLYRADTEQILPRRPLETPVTIGGKVEAEVGDAYVSHYHRSQAALLYRQIAPVIAMGREVEAEVKRAAAVINDPDVRPSVAQTALARVSVSQQAFGRAMETFQRTVMPQVVSHMERAMARTPDAAGRRALDGALKHMQFPAIAENVRDAVDYAHDVYDKYISDMDEKNHNNGNSSRKPADVSYDFTDESRPSPSV